MLNIDQLSALILQHRDLYYNHQSKISDTEFDALVEQLKCLNPNHFAITQIGFDPSLSEWKKEKHLLPLGSLNKLNSLDELIAWYEKFNHNKDICVVEKLDGLSIGAEYKDGKLIKAILRGNAIEGENIFDNFIKMIGIQRQISDNFTGILRGEIVLTNDHHQRYFAEYSNPRNAASGICRRLDGIGCEYLTVYFYQILGNIEFKSEIDQFQYLKNNSLLVPNYALSPSPPKVWEYYNHYIEVQRNKLNYWIDGLVASSNDMAHQKEAGELHYRPRAKIAIKFPNQLIKTTIKDITWTVGNLGRITPIAWFEPVNLLGSVIEKASIYNTTYIEKLGIGINATVLVCKANEIIPRVEKVITAGNKTNTPTQCPVCHGEVEFQGEYLMCLSTDTCNAQITGRVLNWINTLNLLEWGEALVNRLIEEKRVHNIVDLYKLSVEELASLDRMGDKSAQKCYDILWGQTSIPLAKFLGGLSIPLAAVSTFDLLIRSGFDTLDKILNLSYDEMIRIKGMGAKKSKSLFDGLRRNHDIIEGLLKMGIKVQDKQATAGKLNGLNICITGSTNTKRADLKQIIEENGGIFKSSVSKDCTHLIIADPLSTSLKAEGARKNGIKLISEEEFFGMI